jgi:hypothetical protein
LPGDSRRQRCSHVYFKGSIETFWFGLIIAVRTWCYA